METKQTIKHNITDFTENLKPRLYELSESLDSIISYEYYPQEYLYMPIDLAEIGIPMYKKMQQEFGTRILTSFFEAMLGNIDVGDIVQTSDFRLGVVLEVLPNESGMPICIKIKVSKELCKMEQIDNQYINISPFEIVFWDKWRYLKDTFKSDTYPYSLPDAERIPDEDDIYDWINSKPDDESFEQYIDRYSFEKYYDEKYPFSEEDFEDCYYKFDK